MTVSNEIYICLSRKKEKLLFFRKTPRSLLIFTLIKFSLLKETKLSKFSKFLKTTENNENHKINVLNLLESNDISELLTFW